MEDIKNGYLVLSRRIDETIVVGKGKNRVEITIFGMEGNQVRVGLKADRKVPIFRRELYDLIEQEKQQEAR